MTGRQSAVAANFGRNLTDFGQNQVNSGQNSSPSVSSRLPGSRQKRCRGHVADDEPGHMAQKKEASRRSLPKLVYEVECQSVNPG